MFIDSRRDEILNALDLALLHARRGQVSLSEGIVDEVRAAIPIQEFPLAAIKAIFVEGVIAGYKCEWSTAVDRLARARTLSKAQQNRPLELSVLAWMAFMEFNLNNSSAAAELAVEVLQNKDLIDPHTACRAATVLAALYQAVDNRACAERWFQFAKRNSERTGETALTSVIIFDSAVIRLSVERFNRYLSIGASRDLDLELLFVRSAINFDAAGGVDILPAFHNLMLGQLLNLRKEYLDALAVLERAGDTRFELTPMIRAQVALEHLWCRSNLETEDVTSEELVTGEKYLEVLTDDDDQAIACWMFARMHERVGNLPISRTFDLRAQEVCERYLQWRKSFSEQLDLIAGGLL